MFTWRKQPNSKPLAREARYRPVLESLERRELPTVALNVGPTINVSQALGNQREQSIVVNPKNPNNVVAFSNIEDIDGDLASDSGLFEAWSFDGGQTWNTQFLFTDTTVEEEACCDPQAAWDKFGNLFLTYLTANGDVAVALSTDGGQNFSVQVLTFDDGHDQPSIAVGPGPRAGLGSVWISYFSGPPGTVLPHLDTQVAVVTAFGIMGAFSNPVAVPGSDAVRGTFGDIAIGPKGEAVVTYIPLGGPGAGPAQIYGNTDPDGMGPLGWGQRRLITSTNVGPARIIAGTSNNLGIDSEPSLAWDRSNGPHRGRVYLVYTDAVAITGNDTNTMLRWSDNRGLTWSAAVRVNDDAGAGGQFNPAVAVDQSTGNVGISWYDTRNDPGIPPIGSTSLVEVFATVSDDGGKTFARNILVSAGQSRSSLSELPAVSGVRPLGFGDFNKIDFVNGNLQLIWSDNSAGLVGNPDPLRMELATARIRVGKAFAVKVLFPARFTLIDPVNSIYQGLLTIISNSTVRGPFTLTITVPDPSITFLLPANTQIGRTVTFTINANLTKNVPLRLLAQISNPLSIPLPTSLVGFVAAIT